MLTHISLFSGIGCESIAAEWAGFESILHCEIDPDCQKVLRKYWPDVPIIEDVRNVTRENVTNATGYGLQNGRMARTYDNRQFTGNDSERLTSDSQGGQSEQQTEQQRREDTGGRNSQLTLISAGVPCQPASSAGKRRGKADVRWLWPEAIRVLSELQPTWAVFENPPGIASLFEYSSELEVDGKQYTEEEMAAFGFEMDRVCERTGRNLLDEIMDSIESKGYEIQPVGISACSIGAPHNRMRYFIICHTRSGGLSGESWRRSGEKSQDGRVGVESGFIAHTLNQRGNRGDIQPAGSPGLAQRDSVNPDSQKQGLEGAVTEGDCGTGRLSAELGSYAGWSENWIEVAQRLCSKTQPRIRDVDAGTSAGLLGLTRTAKLKMLGNANPPQQYYPIFQAIAEIEKILTV
jgi:DNA (cytosine-5)-methyltransferase 1